MSKLNKKIKQKKSAIKELHKNNTYLFQHFSYHIYASTPVEEIEEREGLEQQKLDLVVTLRWLPYTVGFYPLTAIKKTTSLVWNHTTFSITSPVA